MEKIIKIGFVAVLAAVMGFGAYSSQKTEAMSDLALANVEALAQGESPDVVITCGQSSGKCWANDGYEYTWTPFGGFKVTRCKFEGYTWVSCVPGLPA